MQSPEKN